MTTRAHPVSAVIMTYNEATNIARAITSVRDIVDEVLVLDSFSTDDTVTIAQELGARVAQNKFESYATQRRLMVSMATHDHILTLDADECLSDELKASIVSASKELAFDIYTSNRLSSIGDTWLRHGNWYPDKNVRLFDRRKAEVAGHDVHESIQPKPGARIAHLKGDLLHYADEDINARYDKVNKYSTRAANELFAKGKSASLFRIYIKPAVRFLSGYIFKCGFLDGKLGYAVAKSEAKYVWLRETQLMKLYKTKKTSAR
jgi:glycosyltransferase involved in cell wall biosynthesis